MKYGLMGGYILTTGSTGKRRKNIVKYRKTFQLNLGGVAFLVIFIYLVISCVIYLKKPRISVYEVVEREISDDYKCTGMILRDEKIVNTNKSGYLNYYYGEGTKVGKNAIVYTLDETGEIYDLLKSSDEEASMNKEERKQLWTMNIV